MRRCRMTWMLLGVCVFYEVMLCCGLVSVAPRRAMVLSLSLSLSLPLAAAANGTGIRTNINLEIEKPIIWSTAAGLLTSYTPNA